MPAALDTPQNSTALVRQLPARRAETSLNRRPRSGDTRVGCAARRDNWRRGASDVSLRRRTSLKMRPLHIDHFTTWAHPKRRRAGHPQKVNGWWLTIQNLCMVGAASRGIPRPSCLSAIPCAGPIKSRRPARPSLIITTQWARKSWGWGRLHRPKARKLERKSNRPRLQTLTKTNATIALQLRK